MYGAASWHKKSTRASFSALCCECTRREACAGAEELGEVGRVIESCPSGAFGAGDVRMGEQPLGFEHYPVVDELFCAAADRLMRRPAQRARGVAQSACVPGNLP